MDLNISKCKVIKFSKTKHSTNFIYYINNSPLECVVQIRDLGLLLDSNLDFTAHMNLIINKSLKLLGFIKRSTKNCIHIASSKILYFAFLRTHLEYVSSVWSPNYTFHIGWKSSADTFTTGFIIIKNLIMNCCSILDLYLEENKKI